MPVADRICPSANNDMQHPADIHPGVTTTDGGDFYLGSGQRTVQVGGRASDATIQDSRIGRGPNRARITRPTDRVRSTRCALLRPRSW